MVSVNMIWQLILNKRERLQVERQKDLIGSV